MEQPLYSFKNQVAIITGASKGLGACIAKKFAKEGAYLCLNGRNAHALEQTAIICQNESPNKLQPVLVVGDVTDREVREAIFDKTLQAFKRLDILVNNAGIMEMGTTQQTTLEDFDLIFNVNFRAPYDMSRRAIFHLLKTKGCIVNMSSVVSVRPNMIATAYCISKAALDQLTQCLSQELGPKQVRVVSVNPGVIDTDLWQVSGSTEEENRKFMQSLASHHALERTGTPEEVANSVAFLASGVASFVTGCRLVVDGGFLTMPPGSTST